MKTGSFSLQKERNYSAQTHLKHFHLKDGFFKRKNLLSSPCLVQCVHADKDEHKASKRKEKEDE